MTKWLEIIRLRFASCQAKDAMPQIRTMKKAITCDSQGLHDIRFFRDASNNNDLAIQLIWETEQPQLIGSLIGLTISQDLKQFGLVVHTVWIEAF